MRKYKHILLVLFMLLPMAMWGQLTITNVQITQATCTANGVITVTATGGTGAVRYALKMENGGNITPNPLKDNTFDALAPGIYTVTVYDEVNNVVGVSKSGYEIISTYQQFLISSYLAVSGVCSGTFTINCSRANGPFLYKLKNTTTNQTWEYLETNTTSKSHTFLDLPPGVYSAEVTDACQTTVALNIPTGNDNTTIKANSLNDITFDTYELNRAPTGMGECNITFSLWYADHIINGSSSISVSDGDAKNIMYRIEYPSGTGNYTEWVNGYSSHHIPNYNIANPGKYIAQVKHPCTGVITSSVEHDMPQLVLGFTATTSYSYYENLCEPPKEPALILNLSTTGIPSYRCDQLSFDITAAPNGWSGETKTYQWNNGKPSYNLRGLKYGSKYTITVKLGGSLVKEFDVTTKVAPSASYVYPTSSFGRSVGYHFAYGCDFNKTGLTVSGKGSDANFQNSSYYELIEKRDAEYTIIKSPDNITRPSIKVPRLTTSNAQLWLNLPYGDYEIEASYNGGCRKEIIKTTIVKPYDGFTAITPTVTPTNLAGSYAIKTQGWFHKNGTPNLAYEDGSFPSSYHVIMTSSESTKSSPYLNNNAVYNVDLPAGKYKIKYRPYYSTYPTQCFYEVEHEIDLPAYRKPDLNIPLSGGITCDGIKGTLSALSNGTNPPFKYRYKKATDDDSKFSAFKNGGPNGGTSFENLPAGKYIIESVDALNTRTQQEIRIFNGSEQFVTLINSFNVNTVCEGQTGIISVLSIGPVKSYQWYKNSIKIDGATFPSYEIPNMQKIDAGIYSVVVETDHCSLESSLEVFVHPVLNMIDDYATVLPFTPQAIDIYGNDTFADCYKEGCLQTITADKLQVEGYPIGVLEGDFGKINIVNNKLEFTASEDYPKGVVKITYKGSCDIVIDPTTLDTKTFYGSADLYVYILQSKDTAPSVCYDGTYTVDFKHVPENKATFVVKDGIEDISLPKTYTNIISDKLLSVKPTVNGYLDKFPAVTFTIYVIPVHVKNVRWKGTVDHYWNNPRNWVVINANGADGAKINWVPSYCVNVEIPTLSPRYPKLTSSSSANNVTMKDRAMLAYTHRLTYNSVTMDINFKGDECNRWLMYSAPLKGMYSGDMMPQAGGSAYMSFYQSINPDDASVAKSKTITRPFANLEHKLTLGKAFVFKPKPNGAVLVSSFPKQDITYTYSSIHTWGAKFPAVLKTENLQRDVLSKFIIDGVVLDVNKSFTITSPDDMPESDVIMVTNPFTAYLNIKSFLEANAATLEQGYMIWDGADASFIKYNKGRGNTWYIKDTSVIIANTPGDNDYIAPMQSFFVVKKNTGSKIPLIYKPEEMTTVEPIGITGDYKLK